MFIERLRLRSTTHDEGCLNLTANEASSTTDGPTATDMSANLLGLPRELRDQIYAYVLLDQNWVDLETVKSGSFEQPHSPPLLRTNKMIHRETTLLLYTRNRFNFANCDPEVIPLFLDKIGRDNAKLIWHIRIDFPEFCSRYLNDIRLSDKSILILDKIQSCCANAYDVLV